jgi:hypothetical protein
METNLSNSSSTPVHRVVQADVIPQLRNALIALRDAVFELQDLITRLADVTSDLHRVVLKVEAAVDGTTKPDDEAA